MGRAIRRTGEAGDAAAPPGVAREQGAGGPASVERPIVQAYLLGGFRVVVRGRTLDDEVWQRDTARKLFKWLLTHPRRRLAKDEVIELFWGDSAPEAAASTFRTTVYGLRQALRQPGDDLDILVQDRATIGIRPAPDVWVDADAFERLLAEARRAEDPTALLEQADALYLGEYLPDDRYEDWASGRREALRRLWTDLQLALAEQRERRGDAQAAAAALQRLLGSDPCDEQAAGQLMRLLARHGRRSEALRVYQQLIRTLRDELGVEPAEETVALQRQIASGQLGPTPAAAPGAVGPDGAPPGPPTATTGSAEAATAGADPLGFSPFIPAYPFPTPDRLVGRKGELAAFEQILERGRTGGQVVFLDAPAGTGKSALVGALVRWARPAGYLCLAGGCYEQEGVVPLGPFRDALVDYLLAQPRERVRAALGPTAADLAQVVPELRYHLYLADAPPSPAVDQGRLFGAVHACLRALAEQRPLLLCLEDLHAADAASLDLVHFLARQTRRLPIVLLGTFRSEEVAPGGPLARLLAAMAREGAEQVSLAPLGREATASLIGGLLRGPASEQLSDSLYTTTAGNPLFVEQLVLALREEGRVDRRGGVWQGTAAAGRGLPTVIRDVIGRRFDRLGPDCLELLGMAAVLGQTVEHGALLAALGAADEQELLEPLEQALGAQILQETPTGYAFGHALLREGLYWGLSALRRMLLHARAGQALERLAGPRAAERASELAYHFVQAGAGAAQRAKALHYSLEAGRRAVGLSSHRAALDHFSQACDLIEHEGVTDDRAMMLEALEGRGQAERNTGRWQACVASFRHLLALTPDRARQARARSAIGRALVQIGDTAAGLAEFDAGLAELGSGGSGPEVMMAEVELLYTKAFPLLLQGRFREVLRMGRRMIEAAEQLGQPRLVYYAHSAVALAEMRRGRAERAERHYDLARAAVERGGQRTLLAILHENLGAHHYFSGGFGAARAHLDQAISIYRDAASDIRTVLALQILSRVRLAEGDLERASEAARLGCALAAEGGDRWVAECHDALGAVHALRTEWELAEACFERALAIHRQVGHAIGAIESLLGLGMVNERRGDWGRAAGLYRQALEVARTIDRGPVTVASRRHLGQLLLHQGEAAEAREHLRRALALAERVPRSLEYGPALLAMAELRCQEDPDGAVRYAEAAVGDGKTVELLVQAHAFLGLLSLAAGRPEVAAAQVERGRGLAEQVGSPALLGLANRGRGWVAAAGDDPDAAATSFRAALGYYEAARMPYERALVLGDSARALGSGPGGVERAGWSLRFWGQSPPLPL